jgi:hypothetical protein
MSRTIALTKGKAAFALSWVNNFLSNAGLVVAIELPSLKTVLSPVDGDPH